MGGANDSDSSGSATWAALGSGKSFHPKLPPAYDSNRSWSKVALPYRNPCWNTADTNISFQDGGLPCAFCPVDMRHYLLPKSVNVTVANEFCTVDAYEDTLTVERAITLLRDAVITKKQYFYLAVGLHKCVRPFRSLLCFLLRLTISPLPPFLSLGVHPSQAAHAVASVRCRLRQAPARQHHAGPAS